MSARSTRMKVEAKTASYTITTADLGKLFTNRGDTDAITFTLPAAASTPSGSWVKFLAVADFSLAVAGATGELVVFNDAAANSIAMATASEIIGGGFEAICDGTSWLVYPLGTETQTVTIAT